MRWFVFCAPEAVKAGEKAASRSLTGCFCVLCGNGLVVKLLRVFGGCLGTRRR